MTKLEYFRLRAHSYAQRNAPRRASTPNAPSKAQARGTRSAYRQLRRKLWRVPRELEWQYSVPGVKYL